MGDTETGTRAEATRAAWLETIERFCDDRDAPGSDRFWAPRLDTASQDELRAIQDAKIAAVAPFLYENSPFYRRRFDRLGLAPDDIKSVDDLIAQLAGDRQVGDGRGRAGPPALRHLYDHDRRAVGRARLDDVLVLGLHRRAARVPLQPSRPRGMGLGQRARPDLDGFRATATRCS